MTAVVAVVGAVGLAVATELLTGWVRRGGRGLARLIRRHAPGADVRAADHSAIHTGMIRVDTGGWPSVHVHVRCAPSRRWDMPRRMSRDGVYRFVQRVAPGVFSHEADYAVPDELIRFTSSTDRDCAIACSYPSGAIEIRSPIAHRDAASGPSISVLSIAELIRSFHGEIASGAFRRIFGAQPRRVDWFLNVSPYVTNDDFAHVPWTDMDFPGRRPGGRAVGMLPPADVRGYGRASSQGLRTTSSAEALERVLLTDLLERNGFYGIEGALDDVISATSREPEPTRP